MKFAKTLIAFAVAAASLSANALTASNTTSSGSFLTLSSTGAHTGTLGGIANISGGAVLNNDFGYADMQAFGTPFGGTYLASGPTTTGPSTVAFTTGVSFVSFLWGSPDTYNTLTVTTNLTAYTYVPGSAAGLNFSSTNGSQSYAQYVGFTAGAGESIRALTFASTSDAFEAANFSITPVPEPETYALMLGGLGALGFMARRRKPV